MSQAFSFEFNGNTIATDKQGYLLDYTQWHPDMVPVLAEQESIELTEAHWEVVKFVREFYEEYETSPAIRALVKAMAAKCSAGTTPGSHCCHSGSMDHA